MTTNSGLSTEYKLLKTLYLEGRQVLEKDISGIDVDKLDWVGLDNKGVVNIASQIVHIAGFDNLVRSALTGADLSEFVKQPDWLERFSYGFPRELGVAPPTGKPLEFYMDILRAETEATTRVIEAMAVDLNGSTIFYEDGKEFKPEGLRPHNNLELFFYIPMHDRYHRGQITMTKYVYMVSHR